MTRSAFDIAADLLEADVELDPTTRHIDWKPEPYQEAPKEDFYGWLFLAGRGTGKTDAAAHYIDQHVNGPPCIPGYPGGHRPAIVAPTLGDALESCVNGPTGLKAHNPGVKTVQRLGGTHVVWPNGCEAKLFGAFTPDDVERFRAGGNTCCIWFEELAAYRQLEDVMAQVDFGLRMGPRPHWIATTTPKPKKRIKELVKQAREKRGKIVMTVATTFDNPHLAADKRQKLLEDYEGTRLGRQELYAEILEDVEGALWMANLIDPYRIETGTQEAIDVAGQLRRIVVAVDPSWGTKGDECGIIVCALGYDHRGYVIDDRSMRAAPAQWGAMAADAYRTHQADRLLMETNFQGEQVRLVMQTTDPTIPVKEVRVTRGKQLRAEPIVALYEQGKISHLGRFPALEEQMTSWVPNESDFSPDRIDAMCMAFKELMLDPTGAETTTAGSSTRLPSIPKRDSRITGR